MKLIMTKGLPGSGKTTWAYKYLEENPNTVLVCKDDLRGMMFNSAWTGNREKFILKIRDYIITKALEEGKNVVSHDTNFVPKHEIRLREIAKSHNAEFEIKDFSDIPLEQCIKQDLLRVDSVGEKVIREMYNDWLRPEPKIIEYNQKLPDCIICDIDGTLALFGNENPYDRDFSKDKVNKVVFYILEILGDLDYGSPDFILTSGRKEKYRDVTEEWLKVNRIYFNKLFMRKTEDTRKDFIIKKKLYEAEIKGKYNVLFVLDDRNQVVEMWRQEGLTCLQVADGDF